MALSDQDRLILRELGRVQAAQGFGSRFFWMGLGLTAALTVSGIWLLCIRELNHLDMSLLLFHLLGGFPFVVPVAMFLRRHVRYARVIEGAGFKSLGWVTNLCLLLTLVSGVWLVFRGITGIWWLWLAHVVLSLVGAVGLVVYIGWVLRVFRTTLPATDRAMRFYRLTTSRLGRRVVAIFVATLAATGLGAWAYVEPDKAIEVADYDYSKEGEATGASTTPSSSCAPRAAASRAATPSPCASGRTPSTTSPPRPCSRRSRGCSWKRPARASS